MKKEFLISYIEDNDLGIYPKDILVEAINFVDCVRTYSKEYPTIFAAKELHEEITDNWRKFYTHETQDQLQRSRRDMLKDFDING